MYFLAEYLMARIDRPGTWVKVFGGVGSAGGLATGWVQGGIEGALAGAFVAGILGISFGLLCGLSIWLCCRFLLNRAVGPSDPKEQP